MRTLLKFHLPIAQANEAFRNGTLDAVLGGVMEDIKPEAAYFLTEGGERTGYVVFDLDEPSRIPQIAERLYLGLQAKVTFVPVMTAAELRKGMEAAARFL